MFTLNLYSLRTARGFEIMDAMWSVKTARGGRCYLQPSSTSAQMTAFLAVSLNRFIGNLFKFSAAIISAILVASAFADPPTGVLDETHAAVRAVMAVQSEVTPDLVRQPEILGTAVGWMPPVLPCWSFTSTETRRTSTT
jgi:hypothetical protein